MCRKSVVVVLLVAVPCLYHKMVIAQSPSARAVPQDSKQTTPAPAEVPNSSTSAETPPGGARPSGHCRPAIGIVASKDDAAKTLTVHTLWDSDRTLSTNEVTRITRQGRMATWADIAKGAAVVVSCAAEGGTELAKRISIQKETPGETVLALARAAGAGDAHSVKSLITAGADVNAKVFGATTALDYAVGLGHAEVVKLLLDAGAKKRVKEAGDSLIITAAGSGYADVVKLLLNAGANKDAHTFSSSTFTTIWHGDFPRAGLHPGETFTGASRGGLAIKVTMFQLAPGGDVYVNCAGAFAQTALSAAALYGHVDVVKLLLDAGANKNGFNELYLGRITKTENGSSGWLPHSAFFSIGFTPMAAATQGNHQDVVALLNAAGADHQPASSH
jgi:ankyrin repeat protein